MKECSLLLDIMQLYNPNNFPSREITQVLSTNPVPLETSD